MVLLSLNNLLLLASSFKGLFKDGEIYYYFIEKNYYTLESGDIRLD